MKRGVRVENIFSLLIVFCFALVGCSEINKTTEEEQTEGYIIDILKKTEYWLRRILHQTNTKQLKINQFQN